MYLANSYLKCHETKIKIKTSLHEPLGWFFALSTRLAPPLLKIARLIVWWCYGGASIYIEIDIIFIFLQKIFNSLNSIAENLIMALTIGETMCICDIYFSQIGFYLAHFNEEMQWKSQKFSGALSQTPPGLCPGPAEGLTAPPKPLADYLKPATLLKKRLWHKCFPVNFAKFLRKSFFQNTSGWLLLTWY